jgi:hypothetical protein
MKKILVLILIFSFKNIISQEIKCLKSEFYNPNSDIVKIKNTSESIGKIIKPESKPDSLKLYVFKNTYLEFPKWSKYRRKGIVSGFKIILLNNSSNEFKFLIKGNSLNIKRQVFYKNGWKNLVPLKKSINKICGTGYYKNGVMKPNEFFTFLAPCIEGKLRVKTRIVFGNNIYSNEFTGFIDEGFIEK